MLSVLHIENIAVIQSADILFGPGFNALTGETGAGKSIVVDAMAALTGERTSRELIRTGARSALVTGAFTGLEGSPWLAEGGFSPDENGELLLQREILPDGRNLCRVNGRPVTVAQLRELGRRLLNIHGQHDGQQLLDESFHLSYLDNFSKTGNSLALYQKAYNSLCENEGQMRTFRMDEGEKSRKLDVLNYQIMELENAGLRAGEEEELLSRRRVLQSASALSQAFQQVTFSLSGDDDGAPGAVSLLMEAESALEAVEAVSPELSALRERLTDCRCQAQDAAEEARDLLGRFDFEPGELDQLEGRLDQLYRLKRKYAPTEAELLRYLEKCRRERDAITFADDALERLEREHEVLLSQAIERAKALSEKRREAAAELEGRVQEELEQLDMPKVRFRVEFSPVEGPNGLGPEGMDSVRFLLSANVGEDLKPLQKIASGGELSRIMLCLKNVLSQGDGVSTLVFDEVDAGVSGRAAQRVAEKLCQLSRGKQVLCVTHLPQLAAMADLHFSVEKGERDGRTYTAVEALDRDRRMAELARLTAGERVTAAALESAGELLDAAEGYKRTLG